MALLVGLAAFSLWLACVPTINTRQDEYFRRSWIPAGRKLDSEIVALDLERKQHTAESFPEPLVIFNILIPSVIFRVLVLFANILFSSKLADTFSSTLKTPTGKSYSLKKVLKNTEKWAEKSASAIGEKPSWEGMTEKINQFGLFSRAELKTE